MTTLNSGHVLSSALDTLVKKPLNQADDAALVRAAKVVWYSKEVSWGLSEGLGLKVQALMPFQTRHYEAEQHVTSA